MELDSHLLTTGGPMMVLTRGVTMVVTRMLTMLPRRLLTPGPLPALVVSLAAEGPGLDGHHGGGVGVHEAGQGVDGGHGGGGGALLRRPSYPWRGRPPLPGVVVEGLGDELGVELLDALTPAPLRPLLPHVSEGRVLARPGLVL